MYIVHTCLLKNRFFSLWQYRHNTAVYYREKNYIYIYTRIKGWIGLMGGGSVRMVRLAGTRKKKERTHTQTDRHLILLLYYMFVLVRTHMYMNLGVWAREYIPRGTRFGPMLGEIHPKHNDISGTNHNYVNLNMNFLSIDKIFSISFPTIKKIFINLQWCVFKILFILDRKYFWRVYNKCSNELSFFVDGRDVRKANWMRYVLPAYINAAQVRAI